MLCLRAPPILWCFPGKIRRDLKENRLLLRTADGSCSSRFQDSRIDVSRKHLLVFVRRAASFHASFAVRPACFSTKEGSLL